MRTTLERGAIAFGKQREQYVRRTDPFVMKGLRLGLRLLNRPVRLGAVNEPAGCLTAGAAGPAHVLSRLRERDAARVQYARG